MVMHAKDQGQDQGQRATRHTSTMLMLSQFEAETRL